MSIFPPKPQKRLDFDGIEFFSLKISNLTAIFLIFTKKKLLFADVDTPEPDEKSIITYVSQLYDVFPEPPPGHPLFDVEAQKRLQQFRDLASSLHQWIKENIVIMQVSVV